MASPYAFVSLLTSDSYLPGVLTLAAALKDIHPSPAVHPEVDFQTVCLVTPETVDISSIKLIRKAFDVVVGVEIIEENNQRGLQLLGEYSLMWPTFPLSLSSIRAIFGHTVLKNLWHAFNLDKFSVLRDRLPCTASLTYCHNLAPHASFPAVSPLLPSARFLIPAPHRSPRSLHGSHETSYFPSHSVFKNNFSGCRCPSNSSTLSPFYTSS